MACFGGIANWKFGASRSEYLSFIQTIQTFTEMWFGGSFNDGWTEDYALAFFNVRALTPPYLALLGLGLGLDSSLTCQISQVLFLVVLFLLVLNFLLAIIVDAYTKVRLAPLACLHVHTPGSIQKAR